MTPVSVDELLSAAQRQGWPLVPWRGGSIVGVGAWRDAVRDATPEELSTLLKHLHGSGRDEALTVRRAVPGANRTMRRTTTRLADGKTTEMVTEDLAPPQIQVIRVPRSEPAEWERERDELRAKVASLETELRRLAMTPNPTPQALPRAVVSTTRYHCWRAIAGMVGATSGPVRVVRLDFDQLEREVGDGRSSPATRRLVLEDLLHEAREDREFWLAHPDLRELRFEESAAASLVPATQPLATPSRSAPAAVARVLTPIGFRP